MQAKMKCLKSLFVTVKICTWCTEFARALLSQSVIVKDVSSMCLQ